MCIRDRCSAALLQERRLAVHTLLERLIGFLRGLKFYMVRVALHVELPVCNHTRDEWVATFPFPRVDAALQANGAQRIRWEVLLEHETKPPRKSGGGKSAGAGQAAASSSAAPAPAEVNDGSLVVD